VAPRLLGGDVATATIVMERLPPGPSLAGLLLGADADAARRGLVGLARAMGRMHGASLGRAHDFELRRTGLSPSPSVRHHVVRRLPGLLRRFDGWTAKVGIATPSGVADDLERVRMAMIRPGPFLALVHGDACPDNNRIYGDRAVLLDFQVAALDHCLLDGAYFTAPFPTCWCVARLDPADGGAAQAAYREELARWLPEMSDDGVWLPALAEATACWFLLRAISGLESELREDEQWGTGSMAQRLVLRSAVFADLARCAGVLSALADVADQVVALVQKRWPELEPLPAYPALARAGQPVVVRPDWWVPAP
jgi:hypothetical protein